MGLTLSSLGFKRKKSFPDFAPSANDVGSQIRELQMATSQPLGFAVQYTVTTLAALGVAFYTAWALTLVTLATLPFSAVFLAWISARMQPCIDSQSENLTQASKLANNAISAIDTVKCFNGQDHEIWQYSEAIKKAAWSYLKQAQANAVQIGFVRFVTLAMFVQGFWYGTHLVAVGDKTPGQILTAFWACLMATQAIEQILPQMIVLEKGRAAGATLKAILAQMGRGCNVVRMSGGLTPAYCDGDIEVRNVRRCEPLPHLY
jgi:ATP-binding cassette subfamily B (MDR/TAP) protein 1